MWEGDLSRGFRSAVVLGALGVFLAGSGARAGNHAPNPGFEVDCAGVPCSWSATGVASLARDTTNPNSGVASARVDGSAVSNVITSICLTGQAAGDYDFAFDYRTLSAGITLVQIAAQFYSTASCTGSPSAPNNSSAPVTDGLWHHKTGVLTAPAGTLSIHVELNAVCSGCASAITMNFDDVQFDPANEAPNPGFEVDCAGVPCSWSATGVASLARDTTNPNSGVASARVDGSAVSNVITSICLTGQAAGDYDFAFDYRTLSAGITLVQIAAQFYSTASCTGSPSAPNNSSAPVTDGLWHHKTGVLTAPAGTLSIHVELNAVCSGCASAITMNFDDVLFNEVSAPTVVSATSFTARRTPAGVRLGWRESGEAGILGFEVWRSTGGGPDRRLNRRLVPAGTPPGSTHRLVDTAARARRAYVYRLEAVSLTGARRVVGTTRVPAA